MAEAQFETLEIEDRGAARIISISRPKALNAIDARVVGELTRAFEALAEQGAAGPIHR